MSVQAMTAVITQSQQEKVTYLVLLVLADGADESGVTWYGLDSLTKRTRVPKRSLIRYLEQLEQSGEVQVHRRHGTHNVYRINLPGLEPISAEKYAFLEDRFGITEDVWESIPGGSATVAPVPPTGTGVVPPTGTRTITEPGTTTPYGVVEPPTRKRELSKAEIKADELIQARLLPLVSSGAGYDAGVAFREVWREGWAECTAAGFSPIPFGVRLAGHYYELLTGREPEWSALAGLVKRFGIYALTGLEATLLKSKLEGDWVAYATAVCKGRWAQGQARKGA